MRERPIRTMNVIIEEKPERRTYNFKTNKERKKFIDLVKKMVRGSMEYKEYISFIKSHHDMDKCIVLQNLPTGVRGKRYSVEIHHDPFTLKEIINTVISKREFLGEKINPYVVSEEVMELHFDGKVGLVPLSITQHELTECGKIFIPLQFMYQRYDLFYQEYEDYMDDALKEKIKVKVEMSQQGDAIVASCLDTEFVYMNVDGFSFPEVPASWADIMSVDAVDQLPND